MKLGISISEEKKHDAHAKLLFCFVFFFAILFIVAVVLA